MVVHDLDLFWAGLGRELGHQWPQEVDSSAPGWDRKGADVLSVMGRTDPAAPPERGISIRLMTLSGCHFDQPVSASIAQAAPKRP
jgi:hypothetical protein